MTLSTPVELRRRFARRALSTFSTALAIVLVPRSVAAQQTTGSSPSSDDGSGFSQLSGTPADQEYASPGGVDLRTGRYLYKATDLSIGEPGEANGLTLTRVTSANVADNVKPLGNFTHNWDIYVEERRVDLTKNNNQTGPDYRMIVHFGSRSETFEAKSNEVVYRQVAPGPYAQLTGDGDKGASTTHFTYTAADGTLARFRALGSQDCAVAIRCAAAEAVILPDGTEFDLSYAYNSGASGNRARLTSVGSSRGYALLLEGNGNLITKACVLNLARSMLPANNLCPTGAIASVSYGYDGSRLTSVSAPEKSEHFTYSGSSTSYQIGFFKGSQSSAWLTNSVQQMDDRYYVLQDVTTAQSFVDGRTYSCSYDYTPDNTTPPQEVLGGVCRGSGGDGLKIAFDFPVKPGAGPGDQCTSNPCAQPKPETVVYQVLAGPTTITDALSRITLANYCDPNAMQSLPPTVGHRCLAAWLQWYSDPEGIKHIYTYDGRHNITQVRTIPKSGDESQALTVAATYDLSNPKSASKPTSVTDARNATTHNGYAPEHGGLLWTLQPPPTSGAARPLKLYSFAQKYAYVLDGSGALVQATTPSWLPTGEIQCQTTVGFGPGAPTAQPSCDPGAAQVVTTYEYGSDGTADNLLVRGKVVSAGGVSLRTCYRYDVAGNKIAETDPRAGLTSCPQ